MQRLYKTNDNNKYSILCIPFDIFSKVEQNYISYNNSAMNSNFYTFCHCQF